MDYDSLKLENQLCFPLYAASRQITKLYRPILKPLGLTYTKYITMMALWEKDHVSVTDLGERLFLDSGTLTPLLKKLENQKLIKRKRDPDDERNLIVTLTKKGKKLKDEALKVPQEISSCIDIPPKDAQKLHRLLHLILKQDNKEQCD
ncbi:MAG TPA: MarR family transcriptional regulator [Clostridiales bacterium]|jgi:DNA-binding MarR family transcriptional regulator|nr:MarR family transcriptional regulator [Clostridiales bacterium]